MMASRNQHKKQTLHSTKDVGKDIEYLSSSVKNNQDNAQNLDVVNSLGWADNVKKIKNTHVRNEDILIAQGVMDVEHRRDEHILRKRYLRLSFCLVEFVIYASLIIIVLSGVNVIKLSASVQIAMLTTMVANVIGILLTAMIWLYKKDSVQWRFDNED